MLSNYAITNFVSKHIVGSNSVGLVDVSLEFPAARHWITRIGHLSVLTNNFSPEMGQFAFQFVRKMEMALVEYSRAKIEIETLLTNGRAWSPYFRALDHIESLASLLYQSYDLSRKKLQEQLFVRGDGSSLERLNKIYSTSKHQPAGPEEPLWISNTSIHSSDTELTYVDFETMLRECAVIADRITSPQNPLEAV